VPISLALAIAAAQVEGNYVRRKFRVIASVNRLLAGLKGDGIDADVVRAELRIAGDTDDPLCDTTGYALERTVGYWIYGVPLVGLFVGLAVLWAVTAIAPAG